MTKELKIKTLVPLGLGLAGWYRGSILRAKESTNLERWKSIYTPTPHVCSECFKDIQTPNPSNTQINPNKICAVDFLMTLNWLFTYPTLPVMAQTWKMTEKTCQMKIKKYVKAIQALKSSQVRFQCYSKISIFIK